jgi:glycosyltransferase involved in cell wall biosynthesis
MLSHTETFGLSYVEALSQGLPVIYTEGEGFDNIYPEGKVGYHADSHNVEDIAHVIAKAIENYQQLKENVDGLDMSIFEWRSIAQKYYNLFNQVVLNN